MENFKFIALLIFICVFGIYEIIYVYLQARTFMLQKGCSVKVFPKGASKFISFFTILVGFTMIYTFSLQDSMLYGTSPDELADYNKWHFLYCAGMFIGGVVIVSSILGLINRYAITETHIITNNGQKIAREKCLMSRNGDTVIVTHRPNPPKLPTVLIKFNISSSNGENAYKILDENYPKI